MWVEYEGEGPFQQPQNIAGAMSLGSGGQVHQPENLSSLYHLSQSLISVRLSLSVCETGIKIAPQELLPGL